MRGTKPGAVAVPVVPGDIVPSDPCDACGNNRATRAHAVVADRELVLCIDVHSCCVRYRGGGTPAEYAELLAVSS